MYRITQFINSSTTETHIVDGGIVDLYAVIADLNVGDYTMLKVYNSDNEQIGVETLKLFAKFEYMTALRKAQALKNIFDLEGLSE